jgi:hypothetical protein
MNDWGFAQTDASQEMAQIHLFSIKKGDVEFTITVKEYITPKEPTMHFFAQADKFTNQKTAPYRPSGWGRTMLEALAECVKGINRFPYEAEQTQQAGAQSGGR